MRGHKNTPETTLRDVQGFMKETASGIKLKGQP
jgi:hypothetical protein